MRPDAFQFEDDDQTSQENLPTSDVFGRLLVADLYGNAREVSPYRLGGRRQYAVPHLEESAVEFVVEQSLTREQLYDRVLRVLDEYERRGLSKRQLRTVRALMFEQRSLREHARLEGVSAAAIHFRIFGRDGNGGLARKVPEFVAFWRRLNQDGPAVA